MLAANTVIDCMLIPLKQQYLLLPHATIADIVPLPKLDNVDAKPPFWLGQTSWNSSPLTVIDLESLLDDRPANSSDASKLCILYSINSSSDLKAYGLACYGTPQLIQISQATLKLAQNSKESDLLHFQIQIGNKTAYLANLDRIETRLNQ